MTTRAIRNANPLNLRPSGDEWQGMKEEQTDPGYLQFQTHFHGLRAGAKNLLTYYRVHKRRTVRAIITSWAPPSDDNPTDAYVATVCKALGVGPDQPINLENGQTLRALMEVMIRVEAGSQPFSRDDIEAAINAAYGSHRAPPVPDPADIRVYPSAPGTEREPQAMPMPPLVNQPSPAPTRKVVAGGVAGAVAFVIMALWNRLFPSMPIPAEYATEIASVVVLGATLVTQYFTKNRATDIPPAPSDTSHKVERDT